MIRKITDAARWFAARPLAVYATIFVIYLIVRVIIVAGGEVFQSWDSAVYAYRDDPARNRGPLVSFIGHAPRPWGLPLFFAMFPTDEARAIGQSVLGVFAWTVLAWELTKHLKTRPAQYAAFASVLLFSSLTGDRRRSEIVVTLLAVLELVKMGRIRAQQTELFGEIVIERQAGETLSNA